MGRYLSVIGLFIIGVVIVTAGVYFFLSTGGEGFNYQLGIVLMLIGLLVTGVGAIRGKRTMRSVGYFAQYPPESYMRPQAQAAARPATQPETTPVAYSAEPQPASRPTPASPATGTKAETKEKEPHPVVKVLVCPKCGSENQVTDIYCFSCGKKLRPKTRAGKESSRKR